MPSWAGAISIDLLPAVLIFVLCIVQDVIRREEGEELEMGDMSAGEMMRALRIQKKLKAAERSDEPDEPHSPPYHGEIIEPSPDEGDDIVQRNRPAGATPFPKTAAR